MYIVLRPKRPLLLGVTLNMCIKYPPDTICWHIINIQNYENLRERANRGWEDSYCNKSIPIEYILGISKQSGSTSWQWNQSGNHHQPATYHISDGEIYSGAELTSWPFQWDLTLKLLIWSFYTWIDILLNDIWTDCIRQVGMKFLGY